MSKLLLLGLAVAMTWWGGQGVWTALTNRTPEVAECGAAVDAEWVELRGCVYDLDNLIYSGPFGVPTRAYVPLHAPGAAPDAPIQAVLETKDEALIDWLRDEVAGRTPPLERLAGYVEPQTVRGVVQFGAELSDETRDEIQDLTGLGESFVIVEEGAEPSMFWAALKLLFGLLTLLYLAASVLRALGASGETTNRPAEV